MSERTRRIAGVIFDMDGVLCDSEEFMREAACRMFAEKHGCRVKPNDFVPFVGAGEDRYRGGVAAKYGVKLEVKADKARAYAIYLEIIKGRLKPLPGVHGFIEVCRRRGVKLAVATSADRVKLEGNLREIGLAPEAFDACLTGSDVEHKKPHPEIFVTAARRMGLPADDCLVVEDAPNGIRAALAAGCWCLALTSSFSEGELRRAGVKWMADDLAGVPEELLSLLGPEG